MEHRRRIALLVESSRAYGRGLLQGIARYVRLHAEWSVLYQERGLGDEAPPWLTADSCDGVIARIDTRELRDRLQNLRLPTVDLRGLYNLPGVPVIDTDDEQVAQLGAEHLMERAFSNYAYCGIVDTDYSRRRLQFFEPLVRKAGFRLHTYEGSSGGANGNTTQTIEARQLIADDPLADWLAKVPKPVGVLACNDLRGWQVLNVCRDHSIRVPDEVAVLGIDNDEVLCELSAPSLSSIALDTKRIGFEAATLLDRIMSGERSFSQKTLVEPLGVMMRVSTDVLAVDDPEVATALKFIRENACGGINVEDVLDALKISRSTLERRFIRYIGRSPKEEIIRVRLGRVKQLLLETDYTLFTIAKMTGFEHHEHLSVLFKLKTGTTPGEFRVRSGPKGPGAVQLNGL